MSDVTDDQEATAPGSLELGEPIARRRATEVLGIALGGYLALSVVIWWGAWSTHPSTVTTCGCQDPSLTTWFLAWPPFAISHLSSLFFSTALFHPEGINLISNTGMLAIGLPLAPISWLFGAIVTFNAASTIGPALSALAMFWLLRRFGAWGPAAFTGGLIFGFSPIVFDNIAVGHLNLGYLMVLPLLIAAGDEVFIAQRLSARRGGLALAALVVIQFFLSTELLALAALYAAVVVGLLVAYAAVIQPAALRSHANHALRGLGAAAAAIVVALAYPLWFLLAGPSHLSGLVWPNLKPGAGGVVLSSIAQIGFLSAHDLKLFAGYQGPALPNLAYLGVGALVVVAVGVLVFWRDARLWLFLAAGIISAYLSVGLASFWTPWRILVKVPLLQDALASRFQDFTMLSVAILVGLVVDHVWRSVRLPSPRHGRNFRHPARALQVGATIAGLAVAALAVVPLASALAPNIPLAVQDVAVPRWFSSSHMTTPANQVILTFPPPPTGGSPLTWQAVDRMRFSLASGAGPQSIASRAGPAGPGLTLLTNAASVFSVLAPPTPSNVDALRRSLSLWRVTTIVVPDPRELVPAADRRAATAWALGMLTLAVGRAPHIEDGAWVFHDVRHSAPVLDLSIPTFARCTAPTQLRAEAPTAVTGCVIAGATAR